MSTRTFGSLVSTNELAEHLDRVKVLDGSWHMPNTHRDPYQEFLDKRIRGAQFFGIDTIKDTTVDLPHMLPTADNFADAVGKLGIAKNDQVIVYDSVGVFSAARVYWTFKAFGHQKVSILNGGLPQWQSEQRPMDTGSVKPPPQAAYGRASLDPRLVRDYQAILTNVRLPTAQVLDARPHGRFTGQEPEPRPGLSSGHMPGSTSVPFPKVLDGNKMLGDDELRHLFDSLGVDLNKETIASCGSGITASILYVALERAGAHNISVYDGSWTEYADRPESIIEKTVS